MEDTAIVALYWARDEQALAETATKFGAYCRKIADNILHSAHDVEECENDTWLAAWNSMPDNRPARLAKLRLKDVTIEFFRIGSSWKPKIGRAHV